MVMTFFSFFFQLLLWQAHVRGRLARENYKELLWSVGVLEKALLRWHRRGVGLRGFQAEPEYIDEEEDDIVKVLRRQNLDTAINEAVFKVTSVVGSPRARQQYRRMLESYQQVKVKKKNLEFIWHRVKIVTVQLYSLLPSLQKWWKWCIFYHSTRNFNWLLLLECHLFRSLSCLVRFVKNHVISWSYD